LEHHFENAQKVKNQQNVEKTFFPPKHLNTKENRVFDQKNIFKPTAHELSPFE
jgi:hypothetical protein